MQYGIEGAERMDGAMNKIQDDREERRFSRELAENFPTMPQEVKRTMEETVRRQMEETVWEQRKTVHRRRRIRHMAAAAAAAALTVCATAAAGAAVYGMYTQRVGKYGEKIVVEQMENTENETIGEEIKKTEAGNILKNASVEAGYLPDGMVKMSESLVYCYEDTPWQGGFSLTLWELDTTEQFELLETNIVERESFSVGGHDAVYLKRNYVGPESDAVRFDRMMYIAYPEAQLIVQIFIGEDMSREEAVKFAEGLKLTEAKEPSAPEIQKIPWSQYLLHLKGEQEEWRVEQKTQGEAEALSYTAAIGETVDLRNSMVSGLSAQVTQVEVFDDLSVLDAQYTDDRLLRQTGEDGKLLPNEIQFIKRGDGVETLDEVTGNQTAEQRLVYVTVEYRNDTDQPLYDYCFYPTIELLKSDGEAVITYSRAKEAGADEIRQSGLAGIGTAEMRYFDTRSQEERNGSNYIDVLESGESAVVHMGYVINEDELGYMYLRLDNSGMLFDYSKEELRGCVDIRQ